MTVGIFYDIPNIDMDHHHNHGQTGWASSQGSGFLVNTYDPRLAHFSYGQTSKLNSQTVYEQRIDRYYPDSAVPFSSDSVQYQERHDLHYLHGNGTQISGPVTGLLTPSAENSPIMDPQLLDDDAMTCSTTSSRLSPHSEFASPIHSQNMLGMPSQPWSIPNDLHAVGGAGSSHLSLHHPSVGAPYVSPNQIQNYPEVTVAVQQPLLLPEASIDHTPFQDFASSPSSLALPHHSNSTLHHSITSHTQISTLAPQVAPSIAEESRSSSPEEEDISSAEDSDSDFNPRKRNSPRGKATSKAKVRSKNQRGLRKQIYPRNEPISAANERRMQRGRRTGAGTGIATRRGRNSMGVGSATKSASARPFPCPLAPYGCSTTFGSKNEWKRHVSTQHVKLGVYRCPLCPSASNAFEQAKQQDGVLTLPSDFNRKDLFTQHVRRMHMNYIWPEFGNTSIVNDPVVNAARKTVEESQAVRAVQGGGKVPLVTLSPAAEKKLGELVHQGYVELRKAPSSCICPLCPLTNVELQGSKDKPTTNSKTFAGVQAWETRMEHMATAHLNPTRRPAIGNVPSPDLWARDIKLEEWLLEQGLAEMDGEGVWRCRGVRGNGH